MPELIELTLDTKNLYMTSDLHLNHKNIIKYCSRPWEFSDTGLQEMNEVLIHNLMELPEDCTLLNLGDWALLHGNTKNRVFVHSLIEKLLAKNIGVITVLGNHDRIFMKTEDAAGSHINTEALNGVYLQNYGSDAKSVWYSGLQKILLNGKYYIAHEPFYLREEDKLELHGHVHNNSLHRPDEWSANVNDKLLDNYINCCADVHNFKPVLFEELVGGK